MKFDKSIDWLKNQALDAPNMLDRYDALVALDLFALELKRETLKIIQSRKVSCFKK